MSKCEHMTAGTVPSRCCLEVDTTWIRRSSRETIPTRQ